MVSCPKEFLFKKKFTIHQPLTEGNSWVHPWTRPLTVSSIEEFKPQCHHLEEPINRNNSKTPKINITKFRRMTQIISSKRISMNPQ
jgi:hypothetical protein